jgi:hypothetical protein
MHRLFDIAYLERVQGYHETEDYKKAMRKRKVWIEPLFGEAKQWHGMRQFRLRGLQKVNMEGLMIAAGQNLKRLLSAKGWGRRPWPDGAAGFAAIGLRICITVVWNAIFRRCYAQSSAVPGAEPPSRAVGCRLFHRAAPFGEETTTCGS